MATNTSSGNAQWPALQRLMEAETDVESHDGREIRLLSYIYAHPLLPKMRGSPSTILAVMDEFAAQEEFLISIGHDKARVVAEIIEKEKPKTFVEVGGYVGYSAILVGDAIQRCWRADGITADDGRLRVWSLELDPLCAAIAMSFIDLAGLSAVVKVVVGPASDSLKRLHAEGMLTPRPDMLFLDHVEELYVDEFKKYMALGLLGEGVVVLADNVVRPGAPEYRAFVRGLDGVKSWGVRGLITPGNFEDEIEVTKALKSL